MEKIFGTFIIYSNIYLIFISMLIGLIGTGLYIYQFDKNMTVRKLILTFILGLLPYVNLCISLVGVLIWWLERPKSHKKSFLDKVLF